MTVAVHDALEVFWGNRKDRKQRQLPLKVTDALASPLYILGTLLFIVGSVLFLPNIQSEKTWAAWWAAMCFIVGSVFFVAGAALNAMQTFEAPTRITAQYANASAVAFIIGSTVFLCASVLYMFSFHDERDSTTVLRYAAELFIVGSLFFLMGGVINHYRAHLIMERDRNAKKAHAQPQPRTQQPIQLPANAIVHRGDHMNCLESTWSFPP